jgi:hypothetical protein
MHAPTRFRRPMTVLAAIGALVATLGCPLDLGPAASAIDVLVLDQRHIPVSGASVVVTGTQGVHDTSVSEVTGPSGHVIAGRLISGWYRVDVVAPAGYDAQPVTENPIDILVATRDTALLIVRVTKR